MWLLSFLPNWFFYGIVTVSFCGLLLSKLIPLMYRTVAQLTLGVFLLYGVYMIGGIAIEAEWEAKVAQVKLEMAKKEAESAEVTTKIVTKYVKQIQIVKETGDVIIKQIPVYITKTDDALCSVPSGFVMLHDSASRNEIPDAARPPDVGASEIKISEVAGTVITNYTTYYQVSEQLKALQSWVKEQQNTFNK